MNLGLYVMLFGLIVGNSLMAPAHHEDQATSHDECPSSVSEAQLDAQFNALLHLDERVRREKANDLFRSFVTEFSDGQRGLYNCYLRWNQHPSPDVASKIGDAFFQTSDGGTLKKLHQIAKDRSVPIPVRDAAMNVMFWNADPSSTAVLTEIEKEEGDTLLGLHALVSGNSIEIMLKLRAIEERLD